jgi:hypothetical protein
VSSVSEVLQALRIVEDHLDQARGQLVRGRTALGEAEAALAHLDPHHPETVVPPGLQRADDQIERVLTLVEHCGDALNTFATRL